MTMDVVGELVHRTYSAAFGPFNTHTCHITCLTHAWVRTGARLKML